MKNRNKPGVVKQLRDALKALQAEYDMTKVAFDDIAEDLTEERRKSAELTEMLRTITEEKAGPWFARLVGKEAEIDWLLIGTMCGTLCQSGPGFESAMMIHSRECRIAALRRLLIEGETQRQVDAAWTIALMEDQDRARYVVPDGQHGMVQTTFDQPIRAGDIISNAQLGVLTAMENSVPDGRGGHRVNVLYGNRLETDEFRDSVGRLLAARRALDIDLDQSENDE